MSFMYPRLITIRRDRAQKGEGKIAYGGRTKAETDLIAEGLRANVQVARTGNRTGAAGLPTDTGLAKWTIFTPRGALADGQVIDGDLIEDDLGRRFQVTSDYTNSMGGKLAVDRLEA